MHWQAVEGQRGKTDDFEIEGLAHHGGLFGQDAREVPGHHEGAAHETVHFQRRGLFIIYMF